MLDNIYDIIEQSVRMPFEYFTDSGKRIHYVYLLSSLVIAIIVYFVQHPRVSLWKYLFSKKIWLAKTSIVDYAFIVFNSFVKIILIGPLFIYSLKLAFYTKEAFLSNFGYLETPLSDTLAVFLYTITIFIFLDFGSFFIHYLQHKIPFLWQFHKVHHSATKLNPFTQYRIHPVELIINNVTNFIIIGFLMGVFDYLSGHRIHVFTFMGVNVLNFIFLFLGANLRHSSVKWAYPNWLEHLFISPYQHQIHHSSLPEHHNKNLGSKLAIWDLFFGTLLYSKKIEHIEYGLGEENTKYSSFFSNLFRPFKKIFSKN